MIDKGLNYAYPLRFAEGGDVKAVKKQDPRSGITRARDSSGEVIPGMFVAKYADGTFSAPGTISALEPLRQGIISGEVTTGSYSAADAAKMAEKSTYLKKEGLHVVDEDVSARPGATTNEAIGNDTVYIAFSDGSKVTAQKGMIDALNQYGLLDDVKSRDNFNKVVQNVSAASVQQPNSNLAQAHSLFNTKQIAYNDALMQANPQLAQNRLAFVQQNAPDNQAALAAAQTQVDSAALVPAAPQEVVDPYGFPGMSRMSPDTIKYATEPVFPPIVPGGDFGFPPVFPPVFSRPPELMPIAPGGDFGLPPQPPPVFGGPVMPPPPMYTPPVFSGIRSGPVTPLPPTYTPPVFGDRVNNFAADTRAAGYNAATQRFANSPFVRPEGIMGLQLGNLRLS